MHRHPTDIGTLIGIFFEQFMEVYGDEDMASVATAAMINDLLSRQAPAVADAPANWRHSA